MFDQLKPKYRVIKYLGTEFHKIKDSLYTILEVFIKYNILETKGGDGWRYPLILLNIRGMWTFKFNSFGKIFFNS